MATVTSYETWFDTLDDDKDWNSQPGLYIQSGDGTGPMYAELFCCSSDRDKDCWKDGTTTPRLKLNIKEAVTKEQLATLYYHVTLQAKGNDTWKYTAHLEVTFSDGTKRYWRYDNQRLDSGGSRVGNKYPLT